MTVFLTSIIGPHPEGPIAGIYRENGFLENLKKRWKPDSNILIMAADPDSPRNDGWIGVMETCCTDGSLSMGKIEICDARNLILAQRLEEYDVIVLAGGHTPTQNRFFRRIGLKEKIAGFDGIVIGISAGSMNCAETVYAHPEKDGEAIDSNYQKFLPGLGLTELMIIPHYQEDKDTVLDGLRVMEDVAYPDSMGRSFLCLIDGSYVLLENGSQTLYGEGYEIRDGAMHQLCCAEHHLILK